MGVDKPCRILAVGLAVAVLCVGCASRPLPPGSSAVPSSDRPVRSSPPVSAVDLTGVIPWVAASTVTPAPSDPSPLPRAADARPCQSADVTAHLAGDGAAAGTEITLLRLRNVSNSTCVLKGFPVLTATERGLPDVTAEPNPSPGTSTANMTPGQATLLALQWTVMCPAGRGGGGSGGSLYHTLRVALPGGGVLEVSDDTGWDLTCGLWTGPFYVPEPAPPNPYAPLRASLEQPTSVAAGTTLSYVVELTNTSDEPIGLTPCPAYIQLAGASGPDVERLNCDPVGAIDAHQSVRFEMKLAIPADAARGPAKLAWQAVWTDSQRTSTASVININ